MKRILVCLDPSPRASRVLDRAVPIARATGAKLVLFRAVGMPHDTHWPTEALTMSPNEVVELWRRNAERDLEAIRAGLPADVIDSVLVHVGNPWSAICAAAREIDADLVVIGSHGQTAVDHVLGTTSAKVVNHTDRSVLVVR